MVVAVCAAALAIGLVGKACRSYWHHPSSFACYSDIRALYALRGMDRELFPYVRGELLVAEATDPPPGPWLLPVDGANEYPVLTGLVMWPPRTSPGAPQLPRGQRRAPWHRSASLTAWLWV